MSEFRQFEQQDFTTDYLGDGVRYRLPPRQLGRACHLGWVVVGFGVILSLFMIGWMSGPVLGGIDDLQKGGGIGWFSVAFGCFGLIGLIPGLGMVLAGFAIVLNRTRCQIDVRGGKIYVKEQFFLTRLKRKRKASGIRQLRVADSTERSTDDRRHQEQSARLWLGDSANALLAETEGKDKFLVAAIYPHELLVRLAEELAPRLEAGLNAQSTTLVREPRKEAEPKRTPRTIDVAEGTDDQQELSIVPEQPLDSTATIERRDYGITIEIPPAGLWKGSKGLFFFSVIWNLFISLFVAVAVLGSLGIIEVEGDGPVWIMLLIMIPFVAVGIGLMVAAVNMGRRRATIATADDLVMIVRHSIFGKTTREWSASQIEEICCGNSGMEVNDVPVKELQIIPTGDKKFGCLSQLGHAELTWIAAELNQTLRLQRPSADGKLQPIPVDRDDSGLPTPSQDSRIKIERTIDGIHIDVPPKGLFQYIGLVLFGFVFFAVGIGVAIGIGSGALADGLKQRDIGEVIIATVFLICFGGAGVAIMLCGLVAGRRRFRLTVDHDELTLLRQGPISKKKFRWHRDELETVEVANSGTRVNNRSLYHVLVQSRKGDSVGIMTGHDRADLSLVATVVNESLGLLEYDPVPA